MSEKVGRNDPCPCGSGKKYKACCFGKSILAKKKFSVTQLNKPSQGQKAPIDLMERTFGNLSKGEKPYTPPEEKGPEKDKPVTL